MAAKHKRGETARPEAWDTEEGMLHPPVEDPGAVVAVRFTGEEFQQMSRAARRAGRPTAHFIRAAPLASAAEEVPVTEFRSPYPGAPGRA